MKNLGKYTNIYFVSGFFIFFIIVYLISLVMMNGNISKGSSVEIYHEQLKKEKLMKQN
jgi:hypothetical protein